MLFDRDGTLVVDVPYNGNPALVRPMKNAREAMQALRAAGLRIGVISNQSGVARGMISIEQVELVNRRVDELLGPFDVWLYCPHGPHDGCECRKPLPGMVIDAARILGVDPKSCVVVGDKKSDTDAASAAGAQSILVDADSNMMSVAQEIIGGATQRSR